MVHEKTREAPFDVTGRVLERLWAVIVIDFALALAGEAFAQWGLHYGDTGAVASQLALLAVNILFLFADVSATVDEPANLLLLVPRSIMRSVRFLFSRTAPFVFLVLAVQYLLLSAISLLTYFADGGAQTPVAFWLSLALGTLTIPPLGALATLVYVEVPRLREKG